jgi:hypothetical protein
MANPHNHPYPSTFTGAVGLDEPYHDDPNMTSQLNNDSASPSLRPPPFSDSDATRPPHLSFRSTVGLLPTPGTVSKRHPTYVRPYFWVDGDDIRESPHLGVGASHPPLLGCSPGLCGARPFGDRSRGCAGDIKRQ